MSYNFKNKALEATSLSDLMNGKTKVDTRDIIEKYPDGITVTAVDMVEYEKDGKPVEYPIFLFAENENAFYSGGIVLKKIAKAWVEDFDGNYVTMSDALKESGGVKVKLTSGRSKTGNPLTNVEIL
jgi:hypothetical protein